ncbi:hypothetical protein MPSEU_001025800 [Mayamaea pseudoterrestris]|nr:hypothetical protein MPSEU_001025800 [Mayamaea pseudoterrestris]
MRILSRSNTRISKSAAGESVSEASHHMTDETASASQGSCSSKPSKRHLILTRSLRRRSESTPRSSSLIMTPFRSGRRQSSEIISGSRSKSTPRSSFVDVHTPDAFNSPPPLRRPLTLPSTSSLQLLATLAIDAQTPGSAEVSFNKSCCATPNTQDEYDGVRKRLFLVTPENERLEVDEDSGDYDDSMSTPLLSTRQEHHTVDISSLAMTRTATIQSTEVYCVVVENSQEKRVWETLFQDQDDDGIRFNEELLQKTSTFEKGFALETNAVVSSDEEIEMSESFWKAETTNNVESIESVKDRNENTDCLPTQSNENVAKSSFKEAQKNEPSPSEAKHYIGRGRLRDNEASANECNASPSRERSFEIRPIDDDINDKDTLNDVMHAIQRRKGEQPPAPRRQIVGSLIADHDEVAGSDIGDDHADDISTSSSSAGLRHQVSVMVETVDSNYNYAEGEEEKKDDVADYKEVVSSIASIRSGNDNDANALNNSQQSDASGRTQWRHHVTSLVQEWIRSDAANKVLSFLQCGNDASFTQEKMQQNFNHLCQATEPHHNEERPLYDEKFTILFLKEMMTDGLTIFHLQAPGPDTSEWSGRAVHMGIEPGKSKDERDIEPKLEWTIIPGGTRFEVQTTGIYLLNIHSVSPSVEEEAPEASANTCFTIKTTEGTSHLFEANSVEERDRIVSGIRNVIARLSYHLIAGDSAAAFGVDDYMSDAQWTCTSPDHATNEMAHKLLD